MHSHPLYKLLEGRGSILIHLCTQGPFLQESKAADLGASEVTSGLHNSLLVRPGVKTA